jgi:alpha-mannosidase
LESSHADLDARAFNASFTAIQIKRSIGELAPIGSFIDLQPQKLVLSSIKKAEGRDSLIVRFYNPYDELILGTLTILIPVESVYFCNLAEERQEKLECIGGVVTLDVLPKKIITCEIC